MQKGGYVYIITNAHHTTLYIGVTSNLLNRTIQHKEHHYKKSFSDRYNVEKLVYYQELSTIEDATEYEKKIKKWSRAKKEALVNEMNPDWKDLFEDLNNW
jgi:putative endonuclease